MYVYLVLSVTLAVVIAGYAGSSSDAGNGVDGSGYGYGFSGSTQGQTGGGGNFGPNFPQPPVFDFNSFLSAYFDSLRRYQEQFQANTNTYAYTSNNLNGMAEAQSSIVFDTSYPQAEYAGNSLQQAHQNTIQGYGFPGGFPAYAGGQGGEQGGQGGGGYGGEQGGQGGGSYGGSFGGGFTGNPDGGAVASAGIGPGGGYQTAAVYPENPNSPNIFNRFGESGDGQQPQQPQGQQPGGGFYGVFTSSHSSSTDVDGKKTQVQEAQTTVNDNGKVTTYKVKNP